jgi:hypothetical protein
VIKLIYAGIISKVLRYDHNFLFSFYKGIEGVFRLSCEHVMTTLRSGRETLLTLVESFVYDPLLDWINNETGIIASFYGGGDTGKTKLVLNQNESSTNTNENIIQIQQKKNTKEKRKNMEKKMTHRLYAIRLIENRSLIEKNQESLIKMLSDLETRIGLISDSIGKRQDKENLIRLHEQAKIYLDESLTLHGENNKSSKGLNQHAVFTLHDRYALYLVYSENLQSVNTLIDKQIENYEKLSEGHLNSVYFLQAFTDLTKSLEFINDSKQPKILKIVSLFETKIENRTRNLSSSSTNSFTATLGDSVIKAFKTMTLEASDSLFDTTQQNEEFSEPCKITSEFLNSIGQNSHIVQCDTIYKEMEQSKMSRDELFEKIYNTLEKFSHIFEWLPSSFFVESKHLQLLEWVKVFKSGQYDINTFTDIISNYSLKYNSKFKISSFKQPKQNQQHDTNQGFLIFEKKLFSLKKEVEVVEKQLFNLSLRRTSIKLQGQSQVTDLIGVNQSSDLKTLLKSKHDLIESSLIAFIEEQIYGTPEVINETLAQQMLDCLDLVISQFLNDGLQKWILMENASFSAKDQLCSLKSIDGDWFLEEMLSLALNCNHLTQLAKKLHVKYDSNFNSKSSNFLDCLTICDTLASLFANLKEILSNYQTNLLEKIIKLTTNNFDETSNLLNDLNEMNINEFFYLISSFDQNFQIEIILKDQNYLAKLKDIKSKYAQILSNKTNKISALVLIEFEKMFSKLDAEFDKCIKFCKQIFVQPELASLFGLTQNLVYLLDEHIYLFYKNIFFVKKIQAIQSCLKLSADFYQFNFNTCESFEFSHEELMFPLKNYISEFIIQMVTGLPTIALGCALSCLSSKTPMNQSLINEYYFNNLNQLISNYDVLWSTLDICLRIESTKSYYETHLSAIKRIIEAFEWFNDPVLTDQTLQNRQSINLNSNRQNILDDLQNYVDCLNNSNNLLAVSLEKMNNCEQNIVKRLEWAAHSNPSLNETIKLFDDLRKKRNNSLSRENDLCVKLNSLINMWLNLEFFRGRSLISNKGNLFKK